MRKIISLALIIITAASLLFAGGCFNAGERIAEKITEGAIEQAIEDESGAEVDISDESITMKTEEGETTIGSGADIPEGYPEGAVPVYPDMMITSSQKITQDGKTSYMISAETVDTGEKIASWYKDQLAGWNVDSEYTTEGDGVKNTMVSITGETYSVWLQITEDESGKYVMLSVSEN
ncbi:MAG: hypothetical protein U9O59_05995 [Actinomycetota bacterium]|nr:hypothetical protein [Actinomycetota bacterium]